MVERKVVPSEFFAATATCLVGTGMPDEAALLRRKSSLAVLLGENVPQDSIENLVPSTPPTLIVGHFRNSLQVVAVELLARFDAFHLALRVTDSIYVGCEPAQQFPSLTIAVAVGQDHPCLFVLPDKKSQRVEIRHFTKSGCAELRKHTLSTV